MDHPDSGKSKEAKVSQPSLHRFFKTTTKVAKTDAPTANTPASTTNDNTAFNSETDSTFPGPKEQQPAATSGLTKTALIDSTIPGPKEQQPVATTGPTETVPIHSPPTAQSQPSHIYTHELEAALVTCAKAVHKSHEIEGKCLTDEGKHIMRAALQSFRATMHNKDSTQPQIDAAVYEMTLLYTSVRQHTQLVAPPTDTAEPQHTPPATASHILNHLPDIPAQFIQDWMVAISEQPHLPYHPSLSSFTVTAQILYAQAHFGDNPAVKAEALKTMKALIPSNRIPLALQYDQRVKALELQVHTANMKKADANIAKTKLDAEKRLAKEKMDEEKRIAKAKLDAERQLASDRAAQDKAFAALRRRHLRRRHSRQPSIPDDLQSISSHTSAAGSVASVEQAFRDIWKLADDPAKGVILAVYVGYMNGVSTEKQREASHGYLAAVVSSAKSALSLSSPDAVVAPCYAFTTASPSQRHWAPSTTDNRLLSKPVKVTSGSLTSGDMPAMASDPSETRAAATDETDLDNISTSVRDNPVNTPSHGSVSTASDDRALAWQAFYLGISGLAQPAHIRGAPGPTVVLPTIGKFSRFNTRESKALDIAIAQLHDATTAYNDTLLELDLLRTAGHPAPKENSSIHELTATDAVAVHLHRTKNLYNARETSARHITDLVNKGVPDANLNDTFHGGMRTSKAPTYGVPLTGSVPPPVKPAGKAPQQPTPPPGAYLARNLRLPDKEAVFTELVRHLPRVVIPSMLVNWAMYCTAHEDDGADINNPDTPFGQRWRTEYATTVTDPGSEAPWNPFVNAGPRISRSNQIHLPQPKSRPTVSPQAMWHIRRAEPKLAYMELMATLDRDNNATAYAWIDADWNAYCSKIPDTEDQEARHHAISFCVDYANRCGSTQPPYPWLPGVQTPTNNEERTWLPAPTPPPGAQWMTAAIAAHDRRCEQSSQSDTSSEATPPPARRRVTIQPTCNHPDEAEDDIAYNAACLAHVKALDKTCRRNDGTFHAKTGEPIRDNKETNRSGTARSRARITGPTILLPNGVRTARRKSPTTSPTKSASVHMFTATNATTTSPNYAIHTRNIRRLDAEATALGTILTPADQWTGNPYQPYAADRHDHPWFNGQLRCSNCWGCHTSGTYQPWFVCNSQWSAHHQRMAELIYANKPRARANSQTRHSDQIILEIVSSIDSIMPSFIDDLDAVNDLIAQHPERNTGMVRQLANSLRGVHRILATVGPPPPQRPAATAATTAALPYMGEDDFTPQGDEHTIHAHVRAHARQRAPITQHQQPLHAALQHKLNRDATAASKPELGTPRCRATKDIEEELESLANKWIAVKSEHDASKSTLAAATRHHATPHGTTTPSRTPLTTPQARAFTAEWDADDANEDDGYATDTAEHTSVHIHLHAPLNSTDEAVALHSLPTGPGLHVLMHPDVLEDEVLLHTQLAELGCAPNVTVIFEGNAHLDDDVAIMLAAAHADVSAPADEPDSPATTALLAHASAMSSSPAITTMHVRSPTVITPARLQEAFACSQAYAADLAATPSPSLPTTRAASPPRPGPPAHDTANTTAAAAAHRQVQRRPYPAYQTTTRRDKSGQPKNN
jgi:hypothetical protein